MNFSFLFERISLFAVFIPLLCSCSNIFDSDDYDFNDIKASPTMAFPIGYADMSVQDLVDKDSINVKVYPDGLVYLEYDEILRTTSIRDQVTIPNIGDKQAIFIVSPGVYSSGTTNTLSTSYTELVTFGLTPPEYYSQVYFKQGIINYSESINMQSTPEPLDYQVRITIPEITRASNGAVFSEIISGTGSITLSDFIFNNDEGTLEDFQLIFELLIEPNTGSTTVPPGTVVTASASFSNMDYRYVKGFFGYYNVLIPESGLFESINVSAFDNEFLEGASISFAEPIVQFDLINQIGVPGNFYFNLLEGRKELESISIQTSPVNPIEVNVPANLGDSAVTTVSVTNVNDLINFAPTRIVYQGEARINEGKPTSTENFIADTSELKVRMHAEVPIYGSVSNIAFRDTLEIDFSDLDNSSIERAALKLHAFNEIPLEANVQLFLVDEAYNVIDYLIPLDRTVLIAGSLVDSDGELLNPGIVDEMIDLDEQRLDHLFEASYIIVVAEVNTSQDEGGGYPDVQFKSGYRMNVTLGLQAKLNLTIGL